MEGYDFSRAINLLEISKIYKFMSLKAFICTFSISLSLFPEPICNNVNYQAHIKGITRSNPPEIMLK